mmetsp:Transcript_12733/g.26448  ORF Transcript_12733/g.26448 Transcript_12733/m.26448 type:complete len:233 (+) Transcript_12733:410-1108(+)
MRLRDAEAAPVELLVAGRVLAAALHVHGTAHEHKGPLLRSLPLEVPRSPAKGAVLLPNLRRLPRAPTVAGELDERNVHGASPSAALDAHHARRDHPSPREELRVTRRRHQGSYGQLLQRHCPGVVGRAREGVGAHLMSPPAAGGDLDGREPLHRSHAVPAWNDDAHRRAVGRRQVFAVHLIAEQHVAKQSVVQGQGPLEVLHLAALDPLVGAGKDDLRRALRQPRVPQHICK